MWCLTTSVTLNKRVPNLADGPVGHCVAGFFGSSGARSTANGPRWPAVEFAGQVLAGDSAHPRCPALVWSSMTTSTGPLLVGTSIQKSTAHGTMRPLGRVWAYTCCTSNARRRDLYQRRCRKGSTRLQRTPREDTSAPLQEVRDGGASGELVVGGVSTRNGSPT